MGLFDFFTDEFIEVIDWVESDSDTILWKFPDKDANIKYGAQLTVRESQTALFLDEGKLADIYEPGRFELITQNMPVMTSFRSWKMGFNSPFKADVYYISTKQFTGLKWGTPNPIILRDPEFKQVRVRAFGTYFIKIVDVEKFFKEFAGTKSVVKSFEIEETLRDIIAPKFAEAVAESNVSVLDMVQNYTELGEKIKPTLQQDLDVFGIELTKFQITSTSLPKEVEAFYDKMTNMHMVGDMSKFQQFQTVVSMEEAAKNPKGTNAGVDIGVGMTMANMMMKNMGDANAPATTNPVANKEQSREEILSTLKELGSLKEAGILTEEEFSSKKAELLARL